MKVKIARVIVRGYFTFAIVASFTHLITAATKGGLVGWEAWSVPFLVDGVAILGLIMRGREFDRATRKIGFRTQCGAGLLSLLGNVFAARNLGGALFGVAVVGLFVFTEWLSDRMGSASVEAERDAAQAKADAKAAAVKKGQATRRRNARAAKAVVQEAEKITARA